MIRTKGEAGTGNIVEAVRHMRSMQSAIRETSVLGDEELVIRAKELGVPVDLLDHVRKNGKLQVPNFAAGGVATPADASLMMQLGAESVFVGSGIFKSSDPSERARAIVLATTHYDDPDAVARASEGLKDAMPGLEISKIPREELMAVRGW
jgi:pyridoxal 5'-phosphate synthase pdxS subunit